MDELCYASAHELRTALQRKDVSARELLRAHLARIEQTNPQVNAVVTLTADRAYAEAAAADEALARGEPLGALHGLPLLYKDTDETAGIRTTHGSPLLADHVPEFDELVVERTRAAGAVTLGKTNVPEFAAGSHTVNPVFGLTRNPYDLSRSAGGSSGGAAAALACGMAPLADGSDMGGSLRNPASFCNVVGFRPSPGRVPSWPTLAVWSALGVQGPMGRTVADTALLLSVLAGPDDRSPLALDSPFAGSLDADVRGLRVAWSPDLGGAVPVEPAVAEIVTAAARVFADLGCVVENACPDFDGADEAFRTLRACEFELSLGELRDKHPESLKPAIIWNVDEARRLSGVDVARAERLRGQLFHRMREFFTRYDLLLLPVSQVPPFDASLEYPTEVAGVPQLTYLDWMRSAYYVTVTACPALSVPGGFTADGLPVGVQLVGPHRADLAVLQAGHAFEQATRWAERHPVL